MVRPPPLSLSLSYGLCITYAFYYCLHESVTFFPAFILLPKRKYGNKYSLTLDISCVNWLLNVHFHSLFFALLLPLSTDFFFCYRPLHFTSTALHLSLPFSLFLLGLQSMSSDQPQVRYLLRTLADRISQCKVSLNGQGIADALFGLRNMTTDCPELRALLSALADRIDTTKGKLESQEIGNAL
jgi:hypothetical protein